MKCGNKFTWYHNVISHCLCVCILYVNVRFNLDSCCKITCIQLWLLFICHAPHSSCFFIKNKFPVFTSWIVIEEHLFDCCKKNIKLTIYRLQSFKWAIKYPYLSCLSVSQPTPLSSTMPSTTKCVCPCNLATIFL